MLIKQIDNIYLYIDKIYTIEYTAFELCTGSGYTQAFRESGKNVLCNPADSQYDDPET